MRLNRWISALGICLLASVSAASAADARLLRVYVGTYTTTDSKGIYLFELDTTSGTLRPQGLAAETASPSFLAIHPNKRFLYAVGELSELAGKKNGAVSAFAIDDKTGKLSLLNQQPSGGAGPCFVSVDPAGRNVLVANYSSGSAAVLPIHTDGSLGEPSSTVQHKGSGPNLKRQQGPHAHSINLDPAGRFAFVADLGLDRIFVYRFDPQAGKLTANDPPAASVAPGAGPRHFAFHPSGRFAYVCNEMGSSVTAFAYQADRGLLREIQTLGSLPQGFTAKETNTTAEVQVHPSGRVLYCSNRGHDSIALFKIDPQTGKLTAAGHTPTRGESPRNFGIDPTGSWLIAANQKSNSLTVYRIDQKTGGLTAVGEPVSVSMPVCVKFLAPAVQ